jgi:hypothetical protein
MNGSARIETSFSSSYAQARTQFLAACQQAGLAVTSHVQPLPGIEGETLALDVARDGPADAERVLLISSACHGIEGYCGSGVQVWLLGDAAWREEARSQGVAVVYLHALNPHGFSHGRRVTAEGVDLNRNFHDFAGRLPANTGYDELADALVPASWPPPAEAEAVIGAYAAKHGAFGLQAAISGGQYQHAHGLFYGGREPTWSHRTFRQVLRQQGRQARRVGWIDIHTGLGPSGVGERIFAGRGDPLALARGRAWWGQKVTSLDDGSSSSAPLEGLMFQAVPQECPQAEVTAIAMEYGTVPVDDVMRALRADHWLAQHPQASGEQRQQIQAQMRAAFYTDTPEWRRSIVEQGLLVCQQAVAGLAA